MFSSFSDAFERSKMKYLDHIKNVQRDLHETRKLLEKDSELKLSQETAYQQLIDERRQLLTKYMIRLFPVLFILMLICCFQYGGEGCENS